VRGLTDKVVVVAGGGSGIGEATAIRLAEEGARVVVGDVAADNADAVAARIRGTGGTAVSCAFDISVDESVGALVVAADMTEAAILSDTNAVDVELGVFDRTIAVNLRGFLLCTRHAIPRMLERGGGAIVYTSSAVAHVGEPERPSYAMSKSGINALMRHVSARWGREGIRANCVAPGMVLSKTLLEHSDEAFRDFALSLGRIDRLGEPADIAAAVAFLLSNDAAWITAQVISVDGGTTVRP
jgi:NAD(P)-dependent dehydrogenase (short-subunit alcohol dehydrogenase family)